MYVVRSNVHIAHCTVYNVYYVDCKLCTLYTVQCTLYTIQCTLCIVHCTMYILQCAIQRRWLRQPAGGHHAAGKAVFAGRLVVYCVYKRLDLYSKQLDLLFV